MDHIQIQFEMGGGLISQGHGHQLVKKKTGKYQNSEVHNMYISFCLGYQFARDKFLEGDKNEPR